MRRFLRDWLGIRNTLQNLAFVREGNEVIISGETDFGTVLVFVNGSLLAQDKDYRIVIFDYPLPPVRKETHIQFNISLSGQETIQVYGIIP